MSSLIKNIIIAIQFLLIISCSLSQSSQVTAANEGNDSSEDNVIVTIPRFNPVIEKDIKESVHTRAYASIDRLDLRVLNTSGSVLSTHTYNPSSSQFFKISLALSPGTYKLEGDIYNLNNSSVLPVVSGASNEFVVTAGVKASIYLTMKPTNPEALSLGVNKVLTNFEHTVYDMDNLIVGTEHWFKFTANSAYTKLSMLNNDNVFMGFPKYSFSATVFDSNGNLLLEDSSSPGIVEVEEEANFNKVIKTNPGQVYYICILPVKYKTFGADYISSVVEFVVDNYIDTNASEATAEIISIGQSRDYYIASGINDTDYYKVNLNAGSDYICHHGKVPLKSIKDPNGSLVPVLDTALGLSRYHFTATVSGEYIFEFEDYSTTDILDTYSVDIWEVVYTGIIPSSSWVDGDFTTSNRKLYKVTVDPTKEYKLNWNDNDGDGSKTAYVDMICYATGIDPLSGGVSYQYYMNYTDEGGFYKDTILEFPIGTTEVVLELTDSYDEKGTFAIKIEESTPSVPDSVLVGTNTISDPVNGTYQYYSVSVNPAKSYTVNTGNIAGGAYFSMYTSNKSQYYFFRMSGVSNAIIMPEVGSDTIIVRVAHSTNVYNQGPFSFILEEVVP